MPEITCDCFVAALDQAVVNCAARQIVIRAAAIRAKQSVKVKTRQSKLQRV
jgi:hypothetical protein